jgi:membrane-associated phospholipid phosphatase
MLKSQTIWVVMLAVVVLLMAAAAHLDYFPGDLTVTRFVQSVAPASHAWARFISETAKAPWNLILLAITVALSWKVVGLRAGILALLSFAGMWIIGKWLGPIVARPRPSPDLISVAELLAGYSFPSIFALTYASTIGFLAVLFAKKSIGVWRIAAPALCCLLLLAGWAARIALGAHWPSDVACSYLIGALWAAFLIRFA